MDTNQILTMYTKHNKSTYKIAEAMNSYPNRIRRILIKNGIVLKTKSEAQKMLLKTERHNTQQMEKLEHKKKN